MSIFKSIAIAALAMATATTAATARPTHLTDGQYLAVARCQGLSTSKALGPVDVSGLDALMKAEGRGRLPEVEDRADAARTDALRQAGHAGENAKSALIAERSNACQAYLAPGAASAGGGK